MIRKVLGVYEGERVSIRPYHTYSVQQTDTRPVGSTSVSLPTQWKDLAEKLSSEESPLVVEWREESHVLTDSVTYCAVRLDAPKDESWSDVMEWMGESLDIEEVPDFYLKIERVGLSERGFGNAKKRMDFSDYGYSLRDEYNVMRQFSQLQGETPLISYRELEEEWTNCEDGTLFIQKPVNWCAEREVTGKRLAAWTLYIGEALPEGWEIVAEEVAEKMRNHASPKRGDFERLFRDLKQCWGDGWSLLYVGEREQTWKERDAFPEEKVIEGGVL